MECGKGSTGIAKLVDQFTIADRYARRDVIALAGKLGVDLAAGHGDAIEKALTTTLSADEVLVSDYTSRCAQQEKRLRSWRKESERVTTRIWVERSCLANLAFTRMK
jgi:hypothetical protein